jgi:DNA-binding IclR family transcriptional regulator
MKERTERGLVVKKARLSRNAMQDSPRSNDGQGNGAGEGSAVVARAFAILELVAGADRALSLAEISTLANLPKATVHRLLQQLESMAYVAREPGGRRFAGGPRLLRMGLKAMRAGTSPERHAILQQLVDAIGETCNFTALAGHEVLYLDRVESRWPLRLQFEPGSRVPIHCTASGKLFLAHLKRAERKRILDAIPLSSYTPHTITGRDAFEAELAQIAHQGFSLDRQEFLLGLIAIAVPVAGPDGEVVAAVACHALSVRLNLDQAKAHLPHLRAAARRLSATLSPA